MTDRIGHAPVAGDEAPTASGGPPAAGRPTNRWLVIIAAAAVAALALAATVVGPMMQNTARSDGISIGYSNGSRIGFAKGVAYGASHGTFRGGPAVVKVPDAPNQLKCANGLSFAQLYYAGGGITRTDSATINGTSFSLGPPDPGPRNQLVLQLEASSAVRVYGAVLIKQPAHSTVHHYSSIPVYRYMSEGGPFHTQVVKLPYKLVVKGVFRSTTTVLVCFTLQSPRSP